MSLQEFRQEFIDNLRTDAALNNTDAGDEFISQTFELLEGLGEFNDPIHYYFGKTFASNREMQIDGYCFNDAENSLVLIISDFVDSYAPEDINRKQIEDVLYKKLRNFLEMACSGKINNYCDSSDDILKLACMIRNKVMDPLDSVVRIKFYVITNKKLSDKVKKLKQEEFKGKPVEVNIWHIERFYEIGIANNNEPIMIDFMNDFNCVGIPCLKGKIGEGLGYYAYLAIISGSLLADVYIEYGSRVLEGNVRAFLGTSGAKSVNSGMKNTIIKDPTKFFTYNNGIAATAASIQIKSLGGEQFITHIEDLQIINGGQTTATLATAVLKKDNPALTGIFVPMKITIIEDRETVDDDGVRFYDKMVSNIAKYANSQNKVTAADLFSNNPFHIIMERMSKKILAPPANGSLYPSGWYYERTRMKYLQEQIKMKESEKEKFALKFPKKQIITKVKLAKYMYCIECKPHIVAKGETWVVKDFGGKIDEIYKKNKSVFNEFYFKKCVAATIIFNTVDSYVLRADWYPKGGYKLNIVPYTISKIISSIPSGFTLDWLRIWQQQTVFPSLMREIEIVTKMTNEYICDSHGIIVTEYCKHEDTWTTFRDKVEYKPSNVFIKDLIPESIMREQENSATEDQKETDKIMTEIKVAELGSTYWKRLLDEGTQKSLLNYKEISLLKVAADGRLPSSAQARVIMQIRTRLDEEGIVI